MDQSQFGTGHPYPQSLHHYFFFILHSLSSCGNDNSVIRLINALPLYPPLMTEAAEARALSSAAEVEALQATCGGQVGVDWTCGGTCGGQVSVDWLCGMRYK